MKAIHQAHVTAETAWGALRHHRIAPTPRNFEIWYAYCGQEKPALRQRIDKLLSNGEPLTPGDLDDLYRDFFAYNVNVGTIQEGSRELRQIASQLAEQVSADREIIDEFGTILSDWHPILHAKPTTDDVRKAVTVLQTVTTEAGDRLRALEQLFAVSVMRIGALKQELARAEKEATQDALTGLANRRMFDAALSQATVAAKQDGIEVSLLLLDIDFFKKFNDKHGHLLGDNVLRLLAQVLTNHIKGRDTAARYGGEEFAIILVGASLAAAVTVAEQIRELLERRPIVNRTSGQKLGVVTCSIGVALYRTGETLADFVGRSDAAMYRAKQTGRNRVCAEEPE